MVLFFFRYNSLPAPPGIRGAVSNIVVANWKNIVYPYNEYNRDVGSDEV